MPLSAWLTIGLGFVTLALTQLAAIQRFGNGIAVNARRLDVMETWQRDKSIDRGELKALDDKAASAIRNLEERGTTSIAAIRQLIEAQTREHDLRMANMEREAKENSKILAELRIDVARIPEQLRRQDDMQDLRHKALEHSLANLKMGQQAMAAWMGKPPPAAAPAGLAPEFSL